METTCSRARCVQAAWQQGLCLEHGKCSNLTCTKRVDLKMNMGLCTECAKRTIAAQYRSLVASAACMRLKSEL